MNCPYCNIDAPQVVKSVLFRPMDGNYIWQCPNDPTHRFFRGSMKATAQEYLWQDSKANEVEGDRSGNCFRVEVVKTYKFTKVETTA